MEEWSIRCGNKIDDVVRHIDDVFIRTNPVEAGHLVVRQFAARHLKSKARVRETGDGSLGFRPFEDGEIP
jgi:hypothetical protein